jgi:hypothetical protein
MFRGGMDVRLGKVYPTGQIVTDEVFAYGWMYFHQGKNAKYLMVYIHLIEGNHWVESDNKAESSSSDEDEE